MIAAIYARKSTKQNGVPDDERSVNPSDGAYAAVGRPGKGRRQMISTLCATAEGRKLRIASILTAVVLLMPTLSFSECAWVLWEKRTKGGRTSWEPSSAYGREGTCEEARESVWNAVYDVDEKSAPKVKIFKDGTTKPGVITAYVDGVKEITSFICLPDTVDPRPRRE